MRLNVVKAGMGRRVASLALLAGLAATPALAGDRSAINYIGYSDDARYFAFEEYGIGDGSGFAYSNVFVVDLVQDKWVGGSPFRLTAEDENTSLPDIRATAMEKSHGAIDKVGISLPAEIAAMIGDGVPENDGKSLRFATPFYGAFGNMNGDYELTLETFAANSPEPCVEYGVDPVGFALTLRDGDATREVFRDKDMLPKSRFCPTDYTIHAVVHPWGSGNSEIGAVAIVSIYTLGFEGPDRRFLAIPLAQ